MTHAPWHSRTLSTGSKAGMQSKQGRSGAASSSSKPKAPPGQKVSGPHVFQGQKSSKPPSGNTGNKPPKKNTGNKPPSGSGGKGQDKGKGGSSTKEAFIAGSGSTIGADVPSDFKTEKEKKSFGLAQDEKAIKAFSEGDIEKVKDYEFEDPRNKATANKKFIKLLEGDSEEEKKGLGAFIQSYSKANIPSALLSMVFNPKPKHFTDPSFLAILKHQLDPKEYARYFSDWKDVIREGMGGTGVVSEDFEKFKNAIESASIPQGSLAQKRYAPWDYFDRDKYKEDVFPFGSLEAAEGKQLMSEYDLAMQDYPNFLSALGFTPVSSRFANTVSNLKDIANIDPNMPGMPSDFRNKIFQARQELDRQGRNWMTGNQQSGYSQSGSSLTPIAGLPRLGIAGLPQAATTPVTTTATAPVTTTATTPAQATFAPIDYNALAPQFGPQYPGHYSHWGWGYANGGIVSKARPQQYIEWKKIIKTFPEMV